MAGHSEELLATWKDTTANPAPLGLLGFGLTTMMLNIVNTGRVGAAAGIGAVLALGLFVGGLAQMIAGIMEWKKGNTFGTVAFVGYGSFWISLVFILLSDKGGLLGKTSPGLLGWYLCLWGVFSFFMFFGTLKSVRVLSFVFGTLTILFFMLAIHNWTGSATWGHVAGWVGIVTGFSAFYLAMAEILNEVYGRNVLPIGAGKTKK
jgi:succinate-acetate transporter protein